MKRRFHFFSGFLFLMLISLGAAGARLELERSEMAVGESTTVHLKGAPFIALVEWKVSPELEIVESNSKRLKVRALREGTGSIRCEMNLNVHNVSISVRRPVAPPNQALPTYTPPAYTPPAYTPPVQAAVPASRAALTGLWQIDANGNTGKLEISDSQGRLSGRVRFEPQGTWANLEDMYFDEAIAELSFGRPDANQSYRGRLVGNALSGTFNQWGGRDYSVPPPTHPWSATRADGMAITESPPPAPSEYPGRSSNLARGKTASQSSTSQWSRAHDAQGAVDGVINGGCGFHTDHQAHPWWQVDLGASHRLGEVRLYNRLDCCSERARSVQVMLSDDGRNWRTTYRHDGGVFGGKDGKPLVVALNGEAARHVRLQLNETNWFHLDEVEVMGEGEGASGDASLKLIRDRYAPGESITVDFTAPPHYANDAWVGIIPSHIPHGSEAENDRREITYQYVQKRTSGSMTFKAPTAPGSYDLRLHDTDNNGREVASVSFQVGAAPNEAGRGYTADGGRGYSAQGTQSTQGDTTAGDESLKDVVNQLKGVFGR